MFFDYERTSTVIVQFHCIKKKVCAVSFQCDNMFPQVLKCSVAQIYPAHSANQSELVSIMMTLRDATMNYYYRKHTDTIFKSTFS